MKSSTIVSLLLSAGLAGAAVFGVRGYLRDQAAAMASTQPQAKAKNTIVVAAQPMRFGKLIEPMSLKVIDWPSDTIPQGAFKTVEELIGDATQPRYVMTAIEQSEPILTTKITGPGQRATLSATLEPGMKAISIRVNDVLGVAGFVLPGDRVDIMLTRQIDAEGDAKADGVTGVLLQGVKVLAVDQSADDRSDKPAVSKTVTMEVSTAEAQKLTLASTVGTLSLALRNVGSADVETIQPISLSDLDTGATSATLAREKELAAREQRLASIERMVRQVGESADQRVEDVNERLRKLQDEINKPAPVATPAPTPEPVVIAPPPPPVSTTRSVGVYRDAKREEYQVKIRN